MIIRTMTENDIFPVIEMMRVFYASPAVHTNGSEEIFRADVAACVSENPFLEGYVLEEQGIPAGYVMVAKSFSTEFGKPCFWIEDIYIQEKFRGKGWGSQVLQFLVKQYPHGVLRLEVEAENTRAVHVYQKAGFEILPYMEMIKF